jgi:hypothetical protein
MSADRPRYQHVAPEELERLKQASRDADARALAAGVLTREGLEQKNAFLRPDRTVVRWDRSGRL